MIELINNKIFLDDNCEVREYYTENGNVKGFVSNGCIQSLIHVDKNKRNELVLSYFEYYDLPLKLNSNGKKYLMLGGGAICYPHYYLNKYKDKKIDVVEINEKCIDHAKKYFYLNELLEENSDRINIIVDDAINYISYINEKYDYILIDLFDGNNPVVKIYEDNNIEKIRSILNTNGVIVINYIITNDSSIDNLNKIINIFSNYKIIIDKNYYNVNTNNDNVIVILSNNDINLTNILDCVDKDNRVFIN